MSEGLVNRVIDKLEERRNNVLNGNINCIPSPFRNFRRAFPGIEQGKYYLVSGATKAGKSQIANYIFLYTPILYAFKHPDQVKVKVFYFPLEETPENITLRFMSFLLYAMSNRKIRLSPMELKSVEKERVLDESILGVLRSDEYQAILKFYEDNVLFLPDRNATGVWTTLNRYAEEAGTVHRHTISIENKDTGVRQERTVFDFYEPKDPKEYVIIMVDHVSLLGFERGLSLRESINKLSEYMMILRNHYRYIPVVIQQQSTETTNLEAYKAGKILPNMPGLADSKSTAKDCTLMLGITNPYSFEMPKFPNGSQGYDITKLRDYARFVNIALNREGESNGLLPLYFDGAVNFFTPLPAPNETIRLQEFYDMVKQNKGL